jgi:sulfatase modifying factor 1
MANKTENDARNAPLADLESSLIPISPGNIFLKNEGKNTFWKVELAAFAISRYPVTEALYRSIIDSRAAADNPLAPVVEVSWFDAIAFCNRLSALSGLDPCYTVDGESVTWNQNANGYRLPTEAEWEYASRAGSNAVRYGELDDIAWHAGNSGGMPHRVGQKAPNAFGLHDMIGNAWEWCWDRYDPEVYGEYRVFRGGGWLDEPHSCRASCRRKSHPTYRIDDLGFRVARFLCKY